MENLEHLNIDEMDVDDIETMKKMKKDKIRIVAIIIITILFLLFSTIAGIIRIRNTELVSGYKKASLEAFVQDTYADTINEKLGGDSNLTFDEITTIIANMITAEIGKTNMFTGTQLNEMSALIDQRIYAAGPTVEPQVVKDITTLVNKQYNENYTTMLDLHNQLQLILYSDIDASDVRYNELKQADEELRAWIEASHKEFDVVFANRNREVDAKLAELEKKNEALQKQLDILAKTLEKYEDHSKEEKDSYENDAAFMALSVQVQKLQKQLNDLSVSNASKASINQVNDLSGRVTTVESNLKTITDRINSLDKNKSDKADVTNLKTSIEDLTIQLTGLSSRVDQLSQPVEGDYYTKSEADAKYETKQHAGDTFETKDNAASTYETKQHAEDTYALKTDLQNLGSQISTLQSNVSNSYYNKSEINNQIEEINKTINNISNSYATSTDLSSYVTRTELDSYVTKQSLEQSNKAVAEDIKALSDALASLKKQVNDNKAKIEALQGQIDAINKKYSTLSTDLNSITSRMDQAEKDITNLNGRTNTLENDVTALTGRTGAIENVLDIDSKTGKSKTLDDLLLKIERLVTNYNQLNAKYEQLYSLIKKTLGAEEYDSNKTYNTGDYIVKTITLPPVSDTSEPKVEYVFYVSLTDNNTSTPGTNSNSWAQVEIDETVKILTEKTTQNEKAISKLEKELNEKIEAAKPDMDAINQSIQDAIDGLNLAEVNSNISNIQKQLDKLQSTMDNLTAGLEYENKDSSNAGSNTGNNTGSNSGTSTGSKSGNGILNNVPSGGPYTGNNDTSTQETSDSSTKIGEIQKLKNWVGELQAEVHDQKNKPTNVTNNNTTNVYCEYHYELKTENGENVLYITELDIDGKKAESNDGN